MTLWVDAVMFVDTQLVIAEDSMEARDECHSFSALATVRTDFRVSFINTVCSAREFCTSNTGDLLFVP